MAKRSWLSILALFACFFALGVIGLGAFTRLMDAGLGCPDWPGCYGHITVPLNAQARAAINAIFPATPLIVYKAWAEMIHRYFAGSLSILIVILLSIAIYTRKQYDNKTTIQLMSFLIFLVAYQIILGQLTVTLQLLPIIVTQHLMGGFLIFSTLWVVYLYNRPLSFAKNIPTIATRYKIMAAIGLALVLMQIFLGAWTSTNYASLSCPDFPFCHNDHMYMPMHFQAAFNLLSPTGVNYDGGVLPDDVRATIQMTHRLGAVVVTLYLVFLAAMIALKLKYHARLQQAMYVMLGLLFVQLCLGISNIIFKLPLLVAVCHNLTAALLLVSVITVNFLMYCTMDKINGNTNEYSR